MKMHCFWARKFNYWPHMYVHSIPSQFLRLDSCRIIAKLKDLPNMKFNLAEKFVFLTTFYDQPLSHSLSLSISLFDTLPSPLYNSSIILQKFLKGLVRILMFLIKDLLCSNCRPLLSLSLSLFLYATDCNSSKNKKKLGNFWVTLKGMGVIQLPVSQRLLKVNCHTNTSPDQNLVCVQT